MICSFKAEILSEKSSFKGILKIEILDNLIYCNSAQYVYICIPQISLLEWHPYSIANAPNENKIIYIISIFNF